MGKRKRGCERQPLFARELAAAAAVVVAATAATTVVAIAVAAATAAAQENDDEDDDPQAAPAAKTVITAPHLSTSCFMKVLRGLFLPFSFPSYAQEENGFSKNQRIFSA